MPSSRGPIIRKGTNDRGNDYAVYADGSYCYTNYDCAKGLKGKGKGKDSDSDSDCQKGKGKGKFKGKGKDSDSDSDCQKGKGKGKFKGKGKDSDSDSDCQKGKGKDKGKCKNNLNDDIDGKKGKKGEGKKGCPGKIMKKGINDKGNEYVIYEDGTFEYFNNDKGFKGKGKHGKDNSDSDSDTVEPKGRGKPISHYFNPGGKGYTKGADERGEEIKGGAMFTQNGGKKEGIKYYVNKKGEKNYMYGEDNYKTKEECWKGKGPK